MARAFHTHTARVHLCPQDRSSLMRMPRAEHPRKRKDRKIPILSRRWNVVRFGERSAPLGTVAFDASHQSRLHSHRSFRDNLLDAINPRYNSQPLIHVLSVQNGSVNFSLEISEALLEFCTILRWLRCFFADSLQTERMLRESEAVMCELRRRLMPSRILSLKIRYNSSARARSTL